MCDSGTTEQSGQLWAGSCSLDWDHVYEEATNLISTTWLVSAHYGEGKIS